ncbi:MAG: hypothetical protein NVSMB30_13100 [Hymenobacter sp.]
MLAFDCGVDLGLDWAIGKVPVGMWAAGIGWYGGLPVRVECRVAEAPAGAGYKKGRRTRATAL